jgi:hypothetical protein
VKVSLIASSTLLCVVILTDAHCQVAKHTSGFYARSAVKLWEHVAGTPVPFKVSSPDGRSSVVAKYSEDRSGESQVHLDVIGAVGTLRVDLGPGVDSELSWAPDSQGFFVTTSDQGANGSYRVILVERLSGRLVKTDITGLVAERFGNPVVCNVPEQPNVGGIGWLRNGRRVLVAAEIVNHSVCDSPGTFAAYEVDVETLQITASYSQLEAKRRFARLLGEELRAAPDECITKPKSCYISTNHPE